MTPFSTIDSDCGKKHLLNAYYSTINVYFGEENQTKLETEKEICHGEKWKVKICRICKSEERDFFQALIQYPVSTICHYPSIIMHIGGLRHLSLYTFHLPCFQKQLLPVEPLLCLEYSQWEIQIGSV